MSEAFVGSGGGRRNAATLGPSDWLGLAAAPTFAIMARLTGVPGGDAVSVLCGTPHGVSLLGGMAPMYMLMSAFHSTPWLKLIAPQGRSPKFDKTPLA